MKTILCTRSITPDGARAEEEEFCPQHATVSVIVTFNGHRYWVDLCSKHKKEHDDAAARKRQARKDANRKARTTHENRHTALTG